MRQAFAHRAGAQEVVGAADDVTWKAGDARMRRRDLHVRRRVGVLRTMPEPHYPRAVRGAENVGTPENMRERRRERRRGVSGMYAEAAADVLTPDGVSMCNVLLSLTGSTRASELFAARQKPNQRAPFPRVQQRTET